MFEEIVADTIRPENCDPLVIFLDKEDTQELDYYNYAVMTEKQWEVFRLFEQGYTKTEMANMLGIDESSVRERLHTALKRAVEFHIVNTNIDTYFIVYNLFIKELKGKTSQTKLESYFAFLFRQSVYILNPRQRELIDFVIDDEHENFIKIFLDFFDQTPENP